MEKIHFFDQELKEHLRRHELTVTIRNQDYVLENDLQRGEVVEIWWRDESKLGNAKIRKIQMISPGGLEELEKMNYEGLYIPERVKLSLKILWRVKGPSMESDELFSMIEFSWLEEEGKGVPRKPKEIERKENEGLESKNAKRQST